MLDTFLEHTIQKKLQFYHILQESKFIEIKEICQTLHMDITGINCLIDECNQNFDGLAIIKKTHHIVSLCVSEDINMLKLLHGIYTDSDILRCLKFLITNDTQQPFSTFIDENFLSKSTAYRIRKNCQTYLQNIGLEIENNKVVGEEYRIRFLIALLHYRYGISCYEIDEASIQLARNFILRTNDVIDLNFLEKTVNEYGYFECLLILSWKRKSYPLCFQKQNHLQSLKKLFVYDAIKKYLKETVEATQNFTFSEDDYDYIFLAYCCTNSCVLADKWTEADIQLIHQIIFGHATFANLIQKFETKFSISVKNNYAMQATFIYFFKKFIFELQGIIPDKHFYLDSKKNQTTLKIVQYVTEILDTWHHENALQYPIDNNHIHCLSIQLEAILRQFVKPVHIILISDLTMELEIMKLTLGRQFSSQQICITQFLLNAKKMDFLYNLKDCVILVNHRLGNFINQLSLSKQNIVVSATVELNAYDIKAIQNAIKYYREESFLKTIDKL